MITIGMSGIDREIGGLVTALKKLPNHIARKHITAAAARAVRPEIKELRKNTPPAGGGGRGRRKKGEKPRSSGALRRAVAVKSARKKTVGYAVLGYRFGDESRKATWLEYGTSRGLMPRRMLETTYRAVRPRVQKRLPDELRKSMEAAVNELASGKNPGRSR
jgi:hypothetical protein